MKEIPYIQNLLLKIFIKYDVFILLLYEKRKSDYNLWSDLTLKCVYKQIIFKF